VESRCSSWGFLSFFFFFFGVSLVEVSFSVCTAAFNHILYLENLHESKHFVVSSCCMSKHDVETVDHLLCFWGHWG
jgi:hypothetical protein